ncbi:hypothetical protein [Aquihabitans sp. McL0605]|uniref:hypothetical protein n=1 Tax=Aquihabitans sp. McL0605 TaxID=3415671 RepID=UPI003CF1DC41
MARWSSGDRPLIATTIVHPEGDATFAAAAWLAPAGLRFTLVPGTQQPGGSWHTVGEIPPGQRASLVAVFNSGFKYIDIDGGFRAEGRTQVPLVPGEASFVIRSSGGAEVGAWGETIRDRNDIVAVRQNLKLIVAHGAAAKGLLTNHDGSWGSKHHQVQFTPRSGIGELRDGSLVYVAGPDLDLQQLADAFVAVHAVTAMQLDIHPNMTVFHLFDAGSGTTAGPAHALLDVMTAPLDRYLTTDRRDFIAVNER